MCSKKRTWKLLSQSVQVDLHCPFHERRCPSGISEINNEFTLEKLKKRKQGAFKHSDESRLTIPANMQPKLHISKE